jgi:hypothetical protein
MQQEKDQLLRTMVQMKDQMEVYEQQIEALKKGVSSSQSSEPTNPSEELAKALSELNLKGVEIEKLKKSVSVQNDEIKIFREQLKDKDKTIEQYQKVKAKLQGDVEQLQSKLVGKPYLIGARHLIWDQIITKVTKMWDCFKLIGEENSLTNEADKVIQQAFQELGNRPQIATKIIKSLNFMSKEELRKKGIKDRTSMVMETKKFLLNEV